MDRTIKIGEFCQRAEQGGESCSEWLFGDANANPPSHVCYEAQAFSVRRFVYWRASLDELWSYYPPESLEEWPLPAGCEALQEWYFRRRLLNNRDWLQRQAITEDWLYRLGETVNQESQRLPSRFVPLLSDPSAWIALAVPRQTRAGRLWLLGLVEGYFSGGEKTLRSTGKDDDLHIESSWKEYSTWQKQKVSSEAIEITRMTKGQLVRVEVTYTWIYVAPAILVEAYPSEPGRLGALAAESDKLVAWYNEKLLGKPFKKRGGGRSRNYRTPKAFVADLINVLENWRSRGSGRITKAKVAKQLLHPFQISERNFTDNLKGAGLTWDQAKDLDFLRRYSPPPAWPE